MLCFWVGASSAYNARAHTRPLFVDNECERNEKGEIKEDRKTRGHVEIRALCRDISSFASSTTGGQKRAPIPMWEQVTL